LEALSAVLVEAVVEEKVVVEEKDVADLEAALAVLAEAASVAEEGSKIKIPLTQRDFLFLLFRHP
jgi:hypothetical protein